MRNKIRAFSLIELSIVILIIGIIVLSVIGGKKLIALSNLTKARQLTNSSPVNGIEDLVFWVEATSKNSFITGQAVDGQAITQWNDINPQSNIKKNLTQSTSAFQPLYIASSAINNLPAIRFDGINDYLSSIAINNTTISNSQVTIFIVMNMTSGDTSDMFFYIAVEPQRIVLDSYYWDYANYASGRQYYNGPNIASLGSNIYMAGEDSINQYFYINGVQNITQTNSLAISPFSAPIMIGGSPTAGAAFYAHADIGEIIVFSRALSVFERQQIEQYLSKKWSIKLT